MAKNKLIKTTVIVATYPGDPWVAQLKPHLNEDKYHVLYMSEDIARNFAANNNLGAKIASTPYICFLNSDTIPQEDFADHMEKMLDLNPQYGVVGAKLYFLEDVTKNIIFKHSKIKVHGFKNLVQHAGIRFNKNLMPFEYGRNLPQDHPDVTQPFFSAAVTGACMMVRREEFLSIGGFDEKYDNGWEDTDLTLRYYENKLLSVYQPKAVVGHYYGGADAAGRYKSEDANFDHWYSKWHRSGRIHKIMGEKHMRLDVGCGDRKLKGYIGVDKRQGKEVDILIDLDSLIRRDAWIPFEHEEIDEIYCARTLGYLEEPVHVMNEFYRLLRAYGILELIVPHAMSRVVQSDPFIKRGYTLETFNKYFNCLKRDGLIEADTQKHVVLPWIVEEVRYMNLDETKKPWEYDLEIYARLRPYK